MSTEVRETDGEHPGRGAMTGRARPVGDGAAIPPWRREDGAGTAPAAHYATNCSGATADGIAAPAHLGDGNGAPHRLSCSDRTRRHGATLHGGTATH